MSRWFPRADNRQGLNKAFIGGFAGAILIVGLNVVGVLEIAFGLREFGITFPFALSAGLLTGGLLRAAHGAIAAWRFAIGKGLVWGSVLLLLILLPVATDLWSGTAGASATLLVLRIAAAMGLSFGIYAAWEARKSRTDYAQVFE